MMLGWKNTSVALAQLERLLICKICHNLVNDPCSLEACDHFFCRLCVQKTVGTNSKCPECGAFSWIKDLKTNRQLANTVASCLEMRRAVEIDSNDDVVDAVESGASLTSAENSIWENTEQMSDDISDTYMFPSPSHNCAENNVEDYDNSAEGNKEDDKDTDVGDDPQHKVDNASYQCNPKVPPPSTPNSSSNVCCYTGNEPDDYDSIRQEKIVKGKRNQTINTNQKAKSSTSILQYLRPSNTSIQLGNTKEKSTSGGLLEFPSIYTNGSEKASIRGKYTAVKSSKNTTRGEKNAKETYENQNGHESTGQEIICKTRGSKRRVSVDAPCEQRTSSINEAGSNVCARQENAKRSSKRIKSSTVESSTTPRKLKSLSSPMTPISQRGTSSTLSSPKTPLAGKTLRGTPSRGTPSPMTRRNKRGETPLHVSVIKGHIEGVKGLLAQGADPNTRDNAGWTPLHEACNHGFLAIAELLLDNGALIDTPGGFDHDTPLHDAVANNRVDEARLLVSRGAPLSMRNKQGLLPSDYARTDQIKSVLKETAQEDNSNSKCSWLHQKHSLQELTEEAHKVLLSTGLSSSQKDTLHKCVEKLGGRVVEHFSEEVSHIVTTVNGDQLCPRTMKYLSGVLNGKWIVTYPWITKCMKSKRWEDEEAYEVKGTHDACVDTPKRARVNALKRVPGLFEGCSFYLHGTFDPAVPSKEELSQLIKFGGGKILSREPRVDDMTDMVLPSDHRAPTPLPTVAYHASPDSVQYWCTRYIIYDPLSDRKPKLINTRDLCTAPFTWLMDCISHYQILDVSQ